jgi:hypothetical protein
VTLGSESLSRSKSYSKSDGPNRCQSTTRYSTTFPLRLAWPETRVGEAWTRQRRADPQIAYLHRSILGRHPARHDFLLCKHSSLPADCGRSTLCFQEHSRVVRLFLKNHYSLSLPRTNLLSV